MIGEMLPLIFTTSAHEGLNPSFDAKATKQEIALLRLKAGWLRADADRIERYATDLERGVCPYACQTNDNANTPCPHCDGEL